MATKPERLVNTLLLLQGRSRSCQELAELLEVSRRTVIRDVLALQEMGVPVESKPGAGGGYALAASATIPPLELTGSEAFLLMLAVDGLEQLTDAPFGSSLQSLVAKLRAILPAAMSDKARMKFDRVHIRVPHRLSRAKELNPLIEAVGKTAVIEYDAEKGPTQLTMKIEAVYAEGGFWYASGVSKGEHRVLRADRVMSVTESDDLAESEEPPAYEDPAHPRVVVTLTRKGLRTLEREPHLGQLAHGQEAPATIEFRCPPSEIAWYAKYFGGMGREAQVHQPEALRDLIKRNATDLLQLYGQPK